MPGLFYFVLVQEVKVPEFDFCSIMLTVNIYHYGIYSRVGRNKFLRNAPGTN